MGIDFRPLKWALVLGLCAVILTGAVKGLSSKGPLEGFTVWLTAGILVGMLVLTFFADRRDARLLPSRSAYLTSGVAAFALMSFAGIHAWTVYRDGMPCLIKAGQFQDFNGTSLKLLLNGNYRYCDVGLGETCCSGTWRVGGDTILLAGDDGCVQGTMLIRPCSADTSRTCVCWVSEHASGPEMWILEDNRPQ